MRLDDILEQPHQLLTTKQLKNLAECTQFLEESEGLPLMRALPNDNDIFTKVKVRHRKREGEFVETFNAALDIPDLRQRAVFAYSSLDEPNSYYIFPTNGYDFVYSKEVQNSGKEYKEVFESLLDKFDEHPQSAIGIVTDLLKYNYTNENLKEGLETGAEILVYNIPFFYAVKVEAIEYDNLLTLLD